MNGKQKTLFQAWSKGNPRPEGQQNILHDASAGTSKSTSDRQCDEEDFHARPNFVVDCNNYPGFDIDAGKTWVYPTNYPVRDYQFSIVREALFKNTMVVLPTGLGKTFIAAVVMYNIYRWYPEGKVVFMAPTRPLVAQQQEACLKVTDISEEETTIMTGTVMPERRVHAWQQKRVFFLTPQTLANDLARSICPAASIKCLVIDEAHKALGNHAYCEVIQQLLTYTSDFRVLALTATPGSDTQAVKQVISNLLIAHVELRMEDSEDVKSYSHVRNVEKVVVPLGEDLTPLRDKFLDIINVYLRRLNMRKALSIKNPATLSRFQVLKLRDCFRDKAQANFDKKTFGLCMADFSLCISLYHAYELLLMHGVKPFYQFLTGILDGDKSIPHARAELLKNFDFEELMQLISDQFMLVNPFHALSEGGNRRNSVAAKPSGALVPGHPKLKKLEEILLDHFRKFSGDDQTGTRVIIFSQYRDSVKEIEDVLKQHSPFIRAMSFVGQSSKSGSSITQKQQLQVVKKFREGGFNTLVATCVAEEGLDIGEVDLIICYDCQKSPIRLIQRMGRTGRLREGRVVLLLSEGKEEQLYKNSENQKKCIFKAVRGGLSFADFYQNSPRLVPSGVYPACVKMRVEAKPKRVLPQHRASKRTTDLDYHEMLYFKEHLEYPESQTPVLPNSRFVTLPSTSHQTVRKDEDESAAHPELSLNGWTPWQTTLHRTFNVSHSSKTAVFVEMSQFAQFPSMLPNHKFGDCSGKSQPPQETAKQSKRKRESDKECQKGECKEADEKQIPKNHCRNSETASRDSDGSVEIIETAADESVDAVDMVDMQDSAHVHEEECPPIAAEYKAQRSSFMSEIIKRFPLPSPPAIKPAPPVADLVLLDFDAIAACDPANFTVSPPLKTSLLKIYSEVKVPKKPADEIARLKNGVKGTKFDSFAISYLDRLPFLYPIINRGQKVVIGLDREKSDGKPEDRTLVGVHGCNSGSTELPVKLTSLLQGSCSVQNTEAKVEPIIPKSVISEVKERDDRVNRLFERSTPSMDDVQIISEKSANSIKAEVPTSKQNKTKQPAKLFDFLREKSTCKDVNSNPPDNIGETNSKVSASNLLNQDKSSVSCQSISVVSDGIFKPSDVIGSSLNAVQKSSHELDISLDLFEENFDFSFEENESGLKQKSEDIDNTNEGNIKLLLDDLKVKNTEENGLRQSPLVPGASNSIKSSALCVKSKQTTAPHSSTFNATGPNVLFSKGKPSLQSAVSNKNSSKIKKVSLSSEVQPVPEPKHLPEILKNTEKCEKRSSIHRSNIFSILKHRTLTAENSFQLSPMNVDSKTMGNHMPEKPRETIKLSQNTVQTKSIPQSDTMGEESSKVIIKRDHVPGKTKSVSGKKFVSNLIGISYEIPTTDAVLRKRESDQKSVVNISKSPEKRKIFHSSDLTETDGPLKSSTKTELEEYSPPLIESDEDDCIFVSALENSKFSEGEKKEASSALASPSKSMCATDVSNTKRDIHIVDDIFDFSPVSNSKFISRTVSRNSNAATTSAGSFKSNNSVRRALHNQSRSELATDFTVPKLSKISRTKSGGENQCSETRDNRRVLSKPFRNALGGKISSSKSSGDVHSSSMIDWNEQEVAGSTSVASSFSKSKSCSNQKDWLCTRTLKTAEDVPSAIIRGKTEDEKCNESNIVKSVMCPDTNLSTQFTVSQLASFVDCSAKPVLSRGMSVPRDENQFSSKTILKFGEESLFSSGSDEETCSKLAKNSPQVGKNGTLTDFQRHDKNSLGADDAIFSWDIDDDPEFLGDLNAAHPAVSKQLNDPKKASSVSRSFTEPSKVGNNPVDLGLDISGDVDGLDCDVSFDINFSQEEKSPQTVDGYNSIRQAKFTLEKRTLPPANKAEEVRKTGGHHKRKVQVNKIFDDEDEDFKIPLKKSKLSKQVKSEEFKRPFDLPKASSSVVRKIPKKRATSRAKDFILREAEVSSGSDGSADELDSSQLDLLESSFIDDNLHIQEEEATDVKALYLRSVKNRIGQPNRFKLKFDPCTDNVFSQVEVENSLNYVQDSFCVGDDEIIYVSSEESDIEKIERKTKKVRKRKRIAIADSSSSEDEGFGNPWHCSKQASSSTYKSPPKTTAKEAAEKTIALGRKPIFTGSVPPEGPVNIRNKDKKGIECSSNFLEPDAIAGPSTAQNETHFCSGKNVSTLSSSDRSRSKYDVTASAQSSSTELNKPPAPTIDVDSALAFSFDIDWDDIEEPAHTSSPKETISDKNLFKAKSSAAFKMDNSSCFKSTSHDAKLNHCSASTDSVHLSRNLLFANKNVSRNIRKAPSYGDPLSNVSRSSTSASEMTLETDRCSASTSNAVSENAVQRVSDDSVNFFGVQKPSSVSGAGKNCGSNLSAVDSSVLTVLVSSRELARGKAVMSELKLQQGCKTFVMPLPNADYVVSSRISVTRILVTEFLVHGNMGKTLHKVKAMKELYEKCCIIIEKDNRRTSTNGHNNDNLRHLEFAIVLWCNSSIKVLYSESCVETARLLFGLAEGEKKRGFRIDVSVDLEGRKQQMFQFYVSLPHVSPVCALYFTHKFRNIGQFLKATHKELSKNGCISEARAATIHRNLNSSLKI